MRWGHTLQASGYGIAFLTIPMITWEEPVRNGLVLALSWGLMRYAVFDLGYNLTRGLDPLYVGNTSMSDQIISKMPLSGRAFTKTVCLGVSIAINFKEF